MFVQRGRRYNYSNFPDAGCSHDLAAGMARLAVFHAFLERYTSINVEISSTLKIEGDAAEGNEYLAIAGGLAPDVFYLHARKLGAFMFAFLVCQDKSMWTLMVFLYQFQQEYGNFMIMASLVLSAIPTLVVFILCQRVILRGIVIPTFK